MKRNQPITWSCRWLALALTPTAAVLAAEEKSSEPPVQLSVFEVSVDQDRGYAASSALSGTRTNEKLGDLPNSISVMTQDFLQDLAFNNYFDTVEFATNAENIYNDSGTIGTAGSFSAQNRSGNQVSIRGLTNIRQLRDGFPWYLAADVYNTERIEFSRGPGGLAYGDVDASGIINIVTKRATFQRKGSAQVRYDSFGTRRYSLDVNQPLIAGRLAVRFNAIHSEIEQWKQRMGRDLEGYTGAVRWEPFKNHRTQIAAMYEMGNTTNHLGHLQLVDSSVAYVPGAGTNAPDADPVRPGVQTRGVGMRPLSGSGNVHLFKDIGGVFYNFQSTATVVFRDSIVVESATAASGTDPQNPNRYPLLGVRESLMPRREDWGGPDNKFHSQYYAYTIELKHSFSERLGLLLAQNGQVVDTERKLAINQLSSPFGMARSVFIDVSPALPNPNGSGTIPNPNFEKYYTIYTPVSNPDGRDIASWRGQIVYDAELPWGITQRVVFGGNYRREKYYIDIFSYALAPEEMARRGFTGGAAFFPNNVVYPVHYLQDGNGDAQLAWGVKAGVTQLFRSDIGTNRRLDQSLTTASANVLGSYFKGRVRTSLGLSRDRWLQSASAALLTDPVTNEQRFVAADGSLIPNRGTARIDAPVLQFANEWSTNQTYGGVWHVFPWVSLGAGYFESSQFSENYGLDLDGNALAPLSGEGTDYSVRLHLWDGKLEASATYFSTKQENLGSGVSATVRDELNPLLTKQFVNLNDYRDRTATGWEYQLLANLTRNWTMIASYSRNDSTYTRFFPLLGAHLTEARATAQSRGLNPDDATLQTRQYLEDQEGSIASTKRITASLTTRYSFTQGRLGGFTSGVAARYAAGKPLASLSIGGVEVLPASTTDNYVITNPFFSYRRKFGRTNWTFQLNVNNVFDVRSAQGSGYRWPRYTEPRQFIYTATVAF